MANRVGVFVDTGSIFHFVTKKFTNERLDYGKYLEVCDSYGEIQRSIAFVSQVNNRARQFTEYLKALGYDVRRTQCHVRADNSVVRAILDVDVTLEVVRCVDKLDTVILGSASYHITPLIKWIKEKGVRCVIFACEIPRNIRDEADICIEIDESFLEAEIKVE